MSYTTTLRPNTSSVFYIATHVTGRRPLYMIFENRAIDDGDNNGDVLRISASSPPRHVLTPAFSVQQCAL